MWLSVNPIISVAYPGIVFWKGVSPAENLSLHVPKEIYGWWQSPWETEQASAVWSDHKRPNQWDRKSVNTEELFLKGLLTFWQAWFWHMLHTCVVRTGMHLQHHIFERWTVLKSSSVQKKEKKKKDGDKTHVLATVSLIQVFNSNTKRQILHYGCFLPPLSF